MTPVRHRQRSITVRLLGLLALLFVTAVPGPTNSVRAGPASTLDGFDAALGAWDLDTAQSVLDRSSPGVERDVRAGILALYRAEYQKAEKTLAAALATGELEGDADSQAQHYLALARGSQRALASATTLASADGHVEAVFADPKDAILAPYLFEAMRSARRALGDDLGVRPDHRVRFEFLDDPAKLAMVTPLTVDNIRTTGTVGITKYRRITMITPRVMVVGYGWIDTAVHEYVHYLLTLRTQNRAPVWLQEGLAKLLETRWRREKPAPLDPAVAHLLGRAIARDELVTFQQMYPSVAMLPTQEMAALAYAEVETMLGLVRERGGTRAIAKLLDRVASGSDAQDALAAAWGTDFDTFFAHWKRTMRRRTAGKAAGELGGPKFKDPNDPDNEIDPSLLGNVFSHLGGGKARQHARLGVLLTLRGHKKAAAMQYEKARKADRKVRRDPKLARRLGELYVELGEFAKAVPLLTIAGRKDPDSANIAASESRARLRTGDRAGARSALERAIRQNPFIPSIHCDLAELARDEPTRAREQAQCQE